MHAAIAHVSTQNSVACHPERSEGSQPLRLASQPNRLGSAGIRAGSWVIFVGTAFRGGPPSKFLASTTTLSFRATRGLRVCSVPAIPNLTGSAGILAGSWAFSSTIYDSRTATHESRLTAFVGTAFRGGPPTQFLSSQQLRHSEQREESLFAFPNSQLTNHNLRITKAVNSN